MSYNFISTSKLLFLLFIITNCYKKAACQADWFPKGFGTQLGLSIGLGTHDSRIGVLARVFSHWEHVQVNLELAGFYQAQALGTKKQGFEGQFRAGVVGTWGEKSPYWQNRFMRATSNQTDRPFAVGYSFNCYWNNQKTNQCTGTFGLQVRQINLLIENDCLAFKSEDKYRTGALSLYYQQGPLRIGLEQVSWTADPYAEGTQTITDDPTYEGKAKYGYREMSKVSYANTSAGILRLRAVYKSPWANQEMGASLGVDAEQIRHFIQNKAVHDSFILKNPHIPMLDTDGNPFLFQEGQDIRKPRFYGDVLFNPLTFY